MKLFFDQNLSYRLCNLLADKYPGSGQARLSGFEIASDSVIWQYALDHDFVIVSQDSDMAELAAFTGPPPKVIWLRCGNQSTAYIAQLFRKYEADIEAFGKDGNAACLESY